MGILNITYDCNCNN